MLKAVLALLWLSALPGRDVLAAQPSGPAPYLRTATAGPSPVAPGALTPADAKDIRAVVQGQLDALAEDDAARAFSFAAPNVQQAFGTAPRFLEMVQRGYPAVIRPASVAFLKAEGKNDQAIQRVQMTDKSGQAWLASYSLERQKNRSWRITGCSVTENRSRMI
jgi:hypothetical protein